MKIIIIGAGQVGESLASLLADEANDITVVDTNARHLQAIQERLDIRTVHGTGCHPGILMRARIEDADLVIAVTNSDEINMLSCQVAYTLFRTPTKIARVRSPNYLVPEFKDKLFNDNNVPVDYLITPEQVVTDHISRLLKQPGALQVLDFAEGRLQLVAVRAFSDGPLVGRELRSLHDHMPNADARVAAIYRRDRSIVPEGSTVIEEGDEVFFIASREHIRNVMGELRQLENPYKKIIIAGGGNIGFRLALGIEKQCDVKVIEFSLPRCDYISQRLDHTLVLNGSATDQDLLVQENIEQTDVFLALTNDDEVNIMASLLAKKLGVRKVMTLINNPVYAELVQGEGIDVAISPQQATTGSILRHVRKGDTVSAHSLRRGAAEAMEIIVHGDEKTSKVVGRRIDEIKSPPGSTLAAIVRDGKVIPVHGHTVMQNDDHAIVFVVDKKHQKEVEQLFQVSYSFF